MHERRLMGRLSCMLPKQKDLHGHIKGTSYFSTGQCCTCNVTPPRMYFPFRISHHHHHIIIVIPHHTLPSHHHCNSPTYPTITSSSHHHCNSPPCPVSLWPATVQPGPGLCYSCHGHHALGLGFRGFRILPTLGFRVKGLVPTLAPYQP